MPLRRSFCLPLTAILATGCASVNLLQHPTLVVKPAIAGYSAMSTISPYTAASIDHLNVQLLLLPGGTLVTQKTLSNSDLGNTLTFSNLKAQTGYRIQASAYLASDELISIASGSYVDVTLTNDERPTLTSLPVKLMDRPFNGEATASGLVVTPGTLISNDPVEAGFLTPLRVSSIIAGGGNTSGNLEGTGTSARFINPTGIVIDNSGNFLMGDFGNHCIRKITPAGVATTFVGLPGTYGTTDGTGTAARLRSPFSFALNRTSNILYLADSQNHCIRAITSDGVVSTLAGGASTGFTDGTGSNALFRTPTDIALDASGNLYVADESNGAIRKVTPSGVVTTIAGRGSAGYQDGTGTQAAFNDPIGLTLDNAGNIYVAEFSGHRIRKINTSGVVTTIAGSSIGYTDGQGTSAAFNGPVGLTFDSAGYLYVADFYNHRIRKISPSGLVVTVAGNGHEEWGVGTGGNAKVGLPRYLTFDASGSLYVTAGCSLMKLE